MSRIKKWLLKLVMPSAKTLAGWAADKLTECVNNQTADRKAQVAKYAALSAQVTLVANTLSKMLEDGVINDLERDTIAEAVRPLFEKAVAVL